MVTQDGLDGQLAVGSLAGLQFLEDGGFMQKPAQIHRHQTKHATQDEGDAPCPVADFALAIAAVEPHANDGAQENTAGDAGSQRTNRKAIALFRGVLGHKHPGAGHFTANGSALQHAHQQQQDRGGNTNRGIGGQQANDQRRHGHQEHRQGEHLLATQNVAEVGNQDAANGAGQIAGRKDAQRLQLAHPFRHLGRKEQLANDIGKKDEHHEVIKLQRSAQSR